MEEKQIRPRLTQDEFEALQQYRAFKNSAKYTGVNSTDIKHAWFKSKEFSLFVTNPDYQKPEFDPDKIDWDKIIDNVLEARDVCKFPKYFFNGNKHSAKFDRLVYTDTHIGMKILEYSQYGGRWDYDVIMQCLDEMIGFVISNQKSEILCVDDLGDFLDGFNGKTVRKQHDLPQNMTDQQAFDCGLEFKLKLAGALSQVYEKVQFHNICDDNHAGAFGYIVNSAFAVASEKMFDNVKVTNYNQFINHYQVNDNIFILCHGKDSRNMKFGFKPHISDRGIEKIDNYIDHHYLRQPYVRIEFSKGDTHTELVDKSKPARFEYWNYPAFCPASDWVQTNYTMKNNGFYFFNYHDTNRYVIMPYYFDVKE